jgi:hypothetical protein
MASLPLGFHNPADILIGKSVFQQLPSQRRADGNKLMAHIFQLPSQNGVIQLKAGDVFQQAKAFTSTIEVGIDYAPVDPGFTV